MPLPKSVVKIKKKGVEYKSSVDRVNYTIQELSRAALRDTAKLIRKRVIEKLKLLPGMKRNLRLYRSTQYWVRRRETDLQIGFKHNTWYGVHQELGTSRQPRRNILTDTAYENIPEIRRIQAQYLSAIENEGRAQGLISEGDYESGEGAE